MVAVIRLASIVGSFLLACNVLASSTSPRYSRSSCSSSCLESSRKSDKVASSPGIWSWQKFESVDYHPPTFEINSTAEALAPGLIFITPANTNSSSPATKQSGPFIMTHHGELVWSGPIINSTNFRVQQYKGNPVLTYWSGLSSSGVNIGHGYGHVTMLDTSYKEIAHICPDLNLTINSPGKFKCQIDLHEAIVTPQDTILVSAYNVTSTDLTSIGGPKDGWIYDSQFYEVDIATNKILFRWSSIEHVPVNASKQPLLTAGTSAATPYDYFHINSIDSYGNGFLVNGRHVWQTFHVSKIGHVLWTIDGETGGDFGALPKKAHFEWQHDARVHEATKSSVVVSWFNNYNAALFNGVNATDSIALKLTLPPNSATPPVLLTHLVDNPPRYAESQGNHQYALVNGNGHQITNYGQLPVIEEWGPAKFGNRGLLWTARMGVDNLVQNYRGFKFIWHATPTTKPALVVKEMKQANRKRCNRGFVSWNGATDVTDYAVYEGATKGVLCKAGSIPKKGFETEFGVSKNCVQIAALEGNREVARSDVVCSR